MMINGHMTYGNKNPHGYMVISIRCNTGTRRTLLVHILVALLFILNVDPRRYRIVNHINTEKDDNTVENLEWTDQSGNAKHAYKFDHKGKVAVHYKDASGVILKTFTSMAEASASTLISCAEIYLQCKRGKSTDGPFFEYVNPERRKARSIGVPVVQLNPLNEAKILFVWASVREASIYTHVKDCAISKALPDRSHTAGGFLWRYATVYELVSNLSELDNPKLLQSLQSKDTRQLRPVVELRQSLSVANPLTGYEYCYYESRSDIRKSLGIRTTIISSICKHYERCHKTNDYVYYFFYADEYDRRVAAGESIMQSSDGRL